jgi:hypothetical protein
VHAVLKLKAFITSCFVVVVCVDTRVHVDSDFIVYASIFKELNSP